MEIRTTAPGARSTGVLLGGLVVGVVATGVVGLVDDAGELRDLFLERRLDPLLQGDVRQQAETGLGRVRVKVKGLDITPDDIREGVIAVLSVFVREPMFQGQTKEKLNNPEMKQDVENFVRSGLEAWLNANMTAAEQIVFRIVQAARARLASREAAAEVKRKSASQRRVNLPGKWVGARQTVALTQAAQKLLTDPKTILAGLDLVGAGNLEDLQPATAAITRDARAGLVVRISTVLWQGSDPRDPRRFIAPDLPASSRWSDWLTHRDPALDSIAQVQPDRQFLLNGRSRLDGAVCPLLKLAFELHLARCQRGQGRHQAQRQRDLS